MSLDARPEVDTCLGPEPSLAFPSSDGDHRSGSSGEQRWHRGVGDSTNLEKRQSRGGGSRLQSRPFTGRDAWGMAAPRPVTHQTALPMDAGTEDGIAHFFQPGEALGDLI